MLNARLRNLFVVLFLLFSLTLTFGCSPMPDEETMKKTIIDKFYSRDDMRNFRFAKFKIKQSFNRQKNGENYYCAIVENAYSLERLAINTGEWKQFDYNEKAILYCFIKLDNSWDVQEEGEIR